MSLALSARYTAPMIINPNWNFMGTSTTWNVADNEIAAETVVDARYSRRFETGNGDLSLFFNVNNLFDEGPEEYLGIAPFSSVFSTGTGLGVTGETRGRRYTIGVRMEF